MAEFVGIVVLIVVGAIVVLFVRFLWRMLVGLARLGSTPTSGQPTSGNGVMSAEEEGNVHSGPYGYSPNTAYPETQYGSLFNPDAEWNHEEQ